MAIASFANIAIPNQNNDISRYQLNIEEASNLLKLPLSCVEQEYPNKLSQTLRSDKDLASPKVLHPAFYGCFD